MTPNAKNIAHLIGLAVILAFLLSGFDRNEEGVVPERSMSYSQLRAEIDAKQVDSATIHPDHVAIQTFDGNRYRIAVPFQNDLADRLAGSGAHVVVRHHTATLGEVLGRLFMSLLPILVLVGVWFWFFRAQSKGRGGLLNIGKSRARLLRAEQGRVTFEDVAGVEEARQEVEEIVEFLREPQKFERIGGKIPKGVLLVGPPGTGKTLLARAIAGEANVPFFTVSGSDFVEMFVGIGASRVRDMFEQAKKNAPCILFIDEIDAVGRHRGAGLGGGNDEREQTLNQLLVEMDGFEANHGIIVIAATNRPDVLDPALLRPGRFDRQVVVGNPDIAGREQILRVHLKKIALAPDVDAKVIARGTPGFSGADLANLINEAALLAARRGKRLVTIVEMEDAKDKVMMGAERRSMVMTEKEKTLTAYHEAGHALIALFAPEHDPLHKVTIIPRGRALGVTMSLPERDRLTMTKLEMESRLAMMFGGRIAEELVFGPQNVTTGAANDILQATSLARRMVTEFGMSEKLGRVRYSAEEGERFLGGGGVGRAVSPATAELIDAEIRSLIESAEAAARKLLTERRRALDTLAAALLEHETLSAEDVRRVLKGEPLDRDLPEPRPSRSPVPAFGSGEPGRAAILPSG